MNDIEQLRAMQAQMLGTAPLYSAAPATSSGAVDPQASLQVRVTSSTNFAPISDSELERLLNTLRESGELEADLGNEGEENEEAVTEVENAENAEVTEETQQETSSIENTISEAVNEAIRAAFTNYENESEALRETYTPLEEPSHIEENTGSGNISQVTSRFSSALWYDEITKKTVTLAGLGGIGSYVAFLLGRMNIERLLLYDDDVVEEGNMSGQLYHSGQVDRSKVEATVDNLHQFCRFYSASAMRTRFTEQSMATNIMICGFDNMEARKGFFKAWTARLATVSPEERKKCLFIDGRLAAEEFQIFCITGDDDWHIKKYQEEWLFSDDEAETTICSYKQTSFMANMIGSYIVNIFTNFVTRECDSPIPRCVPFFTSYDAATMIQKVEMI